MSSEAQIAASRRNALKSTGPRTAEGKAASSQNARKNRELILPFEDEHAYRALASDLRRDLAPQTPTESILVENIIAAAWRLRRARTLEAGLYYANLPAGPGRDATLESALAYRRDCQQYGSFDSMSRHESRLERHLHRALHALERLRETKPNEPAAEAVLAPEVMNVSTTSP
jgi:hypothetical protein